jgi:hypothetical protein
MVETRSAARAARNPVQFCAKSGDWRHGSYTTGSFKKPLNLSLALKVLTEHKIPSNFQQTRRYVQVCLNHRLHVRLYATGCFEAEFQGHYLEVRPYMNLLNAIFKRIPEALL